MIVEVVALLAINIQRRLDVVFQRLLYGIEEAATRRKSRGGVWGMLAPVERKEEEEVGGVLFIGIWCIHRRDPGRPLLSERRIAQA